MSVMAEHMNPVSSLHHPYMWPNGIEQKMSLTEQQQLLQKDGRQESGSGSGYYSPSARPESAASSSPPATNSVLVPQPINGAKVFSQSHLGHALQPPHSNHGVGGDSIRKYQCKMCPQIFASKADLQLPTQIHMREPKPYKCRIPGCTKAFSQLSNLQSHSRCHQTDKPYKCNSCYKCFADEQSLFDHIPKHKESKHIKTHICSYCGKSYTQETYLAKHMQKHADR